jgi:hypothetical protein
MDLPKVLAIEIANGWKALLKSDTEFEVILID